MTPEGGEGSGQKAGGGEGDGHSGRRGEGDVETDLAREDEGQTSPAAMDVVSDLDGERLAKESKLGKDPEVGMEFESREAVYDFYKAYGKRSINCTAVFAGWS
ncbi:unnamed protein product [Cuscuta epithymum]|uniref:Uncharacterized protein n=1 Tax=Cuscuta epithymum TaxID=186058 RepID=A0AAV0G6P7_9ASTE|nr:unnamed protein product [Cuscuta epithymum]